jgi:tyrosine-protein phosphatase SIW14
MKAVSATVAAIFLLVSSFVAGAAAQTEAQTPPVNAQSSTSTQNSTSAQRIHAAGLRNAAKVSEQLYRGAQPRAAGLRALQKIGIATIVDLRAENRVKVAWERKTAESLGMRFINIPVDAWAPPSEAQVAEFLSLFRDRPQEKVFVHCEFGDDRTGTFVATYRMAYENFSVEEALREMTQFGFNNVWHPSMGVFVREFPARLESSPALAPFKTTR